MENAQIVSRIGLPFRGCIVVGKKNSPSRHTSANSRTNFRYLTTPQKMKRMRSLRAQVTATERKLDSLKKIEASSNTQGVIVDDHLQDLSAIVEDHTINS